MASWQFQIEEAKSGRAGCKGCKEKIDKGCLRIGVNQDPDSLGKDLDDKMRHMMLAPKWYHFQCFEKFKGPKWFKENLCDPAEVKGFGALDHKAQNDLVELWKLLASGKRLADSTSESLKTMTQNQGILTDKQFEEIEAAKRDLVSKTNAQLQAMCQKNKLAKAGTKQELLERVAENMVLGCLPVCPKCDVGKLKFNRADGAITCPGFYDDVAGHFTRCKGPSAEEPVSRVPWEDF